MDKRLVSGRLVAAVVLLGALVATPAGTAGASGGQQLPADHEPDVLLMTPTSFEFGEVQIGESVLQTADITNVSGSSIVMSGAGGGTAAPFSTSQNCQGVTLAPGDSCQMFFRFTPSVEGPATATSNISWNGQIGSFDLSGVGAAPLFRMSPTSFDFGELQIGETVLQTADITNIGQAAVVMSGAGGATPAPFSTSQSCQGVLLAPGDSCQMSFRFTPTAAGPATATSNISWNGQLGSFELIGVGVVPLFRISPVELDFGWVDVGTVSPFQISEVTNIGQAPVVVAMAGGGTAAPFSTSQNCQAQTLDVGESCQVFHRFTPDSFGPRTATSSYSINGQLASVKLKGIGYFSTPPACTITGTNGPDVLFGTPNADVICGNGGDDELHGMGGSDVIRGGDGFDTIFGGSGTDLIEGNANGDTIIGGLGSDTILGGAGNDVLRGAKGHDELLGGGGRDRLFGGAGNDNLFGGAGNDTCEGGPGNDTVVGC